MSFDLLYASCKNDKEKALDHIGALRAKLRMFPNAANPDHMELENMIQTAAIIIKHALDFTSSNTIRQQPLKVLKRKAMPVTV